MCLGEAGLPGEQRPIGRLGSLGIGRPPSSRGQEFAGERFALAAERVLRAEYERLGSKPASFAGGEISTGIAPIRSA